MNIIEITESNHKDYSSIDIAAFSFAYAGAMGEMGGIYIIDRDGKIYHANYCYGDDCIAADHIKDIIPVFEDIDWHMLGSDSNNVDWGTVYLGYGNNLLMRKEIYAEFNKKVEEADFEHSGELFQRWPGIVLDLLGKENDHLTMSDIWDLRKHS